VIDSKPNKVYKAHQEILANAGPFTFPKVLILRLFSPIFTSYISFLVTRGLLIIPISYSTAIAIIQLVFFAPGLALTILLCSRQGWAVVVATWRFIILLALLRITSVIYQIILVTYLLEGILVAIIVYDLIGIALLTLTTVGLLERV
jgi:hypothetical protein